MFLNGCLYIINAISHFDWIDVSEGLDISKTSGSKKCDITIIIYCHYWYFLNKGFTFQPNVCNRCHVLLTISVNLSDITILSINSADYCCIISGISKNETINVMQNVDLTGKTRAF